MEQNNILPNAEQMRIETLENRVKLANEEIFEVLQVIKKFSKMGQFTCYWGTMFPQTKKHLINLGYKLIVSYPRDICSDEVGVLKGKEEEICYDISWE